MCPGISGPGIRVYPFTHKLVGFGLLLESDGRPDHLFLGTLRMKPAEVIQAVVAHWRKGSKAKPPPFVFFVDEADTEAAIEINNLRTCWPRLYPGDTLTVFISNASAAEIHDAASGVLSAWEVDHPGESYPRATEETTH